MTIDCQECNDYAELIYSRGEIAQEEKEKLALDRHILKGCDKSKDLLIVMCPPYPEYETPPNDQSHSELFDCPKCHGEMWLSEKKKGVLMFASCIGQDIFLACYTCINEEVKNDPSFFGNPLQVNL